MKSRTRNIAAAALLLVANFVVGILIAPAHGADDGNPIPVDARQIVWSEPEWPSQVNPDGNKTTWAGITFSGGTQTTSATYPSISATKFVGATDLLGGTWGGAKLCVQGLDCIADGFDYISATGVLELCSEAGRAPCIEGLSYRMGSGDFRTADYLFTANPAPTPAEIAARPSSSLKPTATLTKLGWSGISDIPDSASGPHIFRLPGANNSAGTDTYTLIPGYTYIRDPNHKTNAGIQDFQVSIKPVLVDSSKHQLAFVDNYLNRSGLPTVGITTSGKLSEGGIGYYDRNSIGYAAQFPPGLELKLKLRLNKSLGGWFQGRLNQPEVAMSSLNADENLVEVTAKPVMVPTSSVELAVTDLANKDALAAIRFPMDAASVDKYASVMGTDQAPIYSAWYSWTPGMNPDLIKALANPLGNRAKGFVSIWDFKRLNTFIPCMSDNSQLQGLLATNAMIYQPDLPTFSNSELSYKVSGLHYDSKGDVFRGDYSFIMRDSVARCLYHFSDAPISGTVSVTSSDGSEQVAYTNVTDRDGWLKLTAQGFTFSSPVISAKLTQKELATPPPAQISSPTPSPSAPVNKGSALVGLPKSSVICVKGKQVKKVSGYSPKCPVGYRKKG